ncbi:hypothetical protein SAY87_010634 [Trapa incisa]|uniref:NADH-ubiquinone reductase complex 1 MLRQ subunit n=1 Tax=Trapa incisa TaxID=236973 RepID=A0AAN7JI58_9MYRT|nr:hypothetical protein SAY87_010634 [Trapa incisa]
MASSSVNRWLRPEAYPLFAAVGVAIGICGFQLVRNICINPEVRSLSPPLTPFPWISLIIGSGDGFKGRIAPLDWVNKESRAAGVLENFSEGEKYAEHALRKYVRNRAPEIMPSINSFFTRPERA